MVQTFFHLFMDRIPEGFVGVVPGKYRGGIAPR